MVYRPDRVITLDQISETFSNEAVAKIANSAGLPQSADLSRLANAVREAVEIYVDEMRLPPPSEERKIIECLYRVCTKGAQTKKTRRKGTSVAEDARTKAAELLEKLPQEWVNKLTRNGRRALPSPSELRGENGAAACEALAAILRIGGKEKAGRRRLGNKQSQTSIEPILYTSFPKRGQPQRFAELNLEMWLRVAWVETIGTEAPLTANSAEGKKGPLVKFCDQIFALAGASSAISTTAINNLSENRKAPLKSSFTTVTE